MTLHARLTEARARLVAAGISARDAPLDVDLYARTILGWDRARLLAERRLPVPAALEPTFSAWIARRVRREPSAYIVGVREFWGLEFTVTPAVLIPRPETELVVEEALRALQSGTPGPASSGHSSSHVSSGVRSNGRAPRVADIGTGSGCVAVAIAHEHPACRVVASDISPAALDVARRNALRHHVGDRIDFVAARYLEGIQAAFHVITANPPYVKETDKPALSAEVRHEPDVALFGGADGLRDLAAVLDAAAGSLLPGGWLVMEFGYGQEQAVADLVAARAALRLDRVREDLQGIARTAVIQKGTAETGRAG